MNLQTDFQDDQVVNCNVLSQNALARAAARRALKQRTLTEIKYLARTHTNLAIKTLVQIMRGKDAPAHARVMAANAILDRGWGKPLQPIASEDDNPIQFVHRIERAIVHPGADVTMEAHIEEAVQRGPISVLGSLGAIRDEDASYEDFGWSRRRRHERYTSEVASNAG
ncbi:hypothetical protein [Bradyrhizobium sp. CCBAU 51765]|uniref:hypothetical protein n=1 Tax=Bradyrhizobium sp. CCBAU 51765 TaxID=1325102 RepID=UPI0018880609|nr:hypothetical protein [Bradyrhizobium sp. CCBAU 51765]